MSDKALAQVIWDYMRFEQPLHKADLILGLGSVDTRSALHSAALYRQGLAPKILFSGGYGKLSKLRHDKSEAEIFADIAVQTGVPSKDILLEASSRGTGENIMFSYEILQKEDAVPKSIILVTKPYMLRRAYATFIKQWPDEIKPEVICSAIDQTFEAYCSEPGFSFEYVVNIMVGDLQRIKEYPKLGFQIEQAIPQAVWDAFEELVKRGYRQHLLK